MLKYYRFSRDLIWLIYSTVKLEIGHRGVLTAENCSFLPFSLKKINNLDCTYFLDSGTYRVPVPYFSFSSFILCVSQRTSTLYRYCKLFVVAEIMNLFVLVLVVLLLHFFLDSQFLSFGPEFFRYYLGSENDLPNPAVRYVIIVHCG